MFWGNKIENRRLSVVRRDLVLVGNYSQGSNGLALMGRLAARAFEKMHVPAHCADISSVELKKAIYETKACVVYENPPVQRHVDRIGKVEGPIYGVWHWELPVMHPSWKESIKQVDEIWCPSLYVQSIFEGCGKPTRLVPHPIFLEDYIKVPRDRRARADAEFQVLVLYDARSSPVRKNPIGAVRAFKRAFGTDRSAHLFIKVQYGGTFPELFRELLKEAQAPNITILDEVIPYSEVLRFIRSSDVLLSLHRAEGFGLTMMEAMALEVPVIATGYSGNLTFMNSDNSILIPYELVEVKDPHPAYFSIQATWADPDIEEAAKALRDLRSSQELRERLTGAARQTLQERFSPEAWFSRLPQDIQKQAKPVQSNKGAEEKRRVDYSKTLHFCWFIEPWAQSREKYLLAWQKLGWHCVLWHSGQINEPPVPGVELRLVDDLIAGSDIEEVFKYERHYGSHASCADLFRYFVLHQLGGAYADIDVLPDPEGEIASGLEYDWPLFGVPEGNLTALEIRFIRSAAGHELMNRLVEQAVENEKRYLSKGGYRSMKNKSIISRTGPAMALGVVLRYAREVGRPLEAFLVKATLDNTPENRDGPGFAMGFVRAMHIMTRRKEYPSFPSFWGKKEKPRRVEPDGVVVSSRK